MAAVCSLACGALADPPAAPAAKTEAKSEPKAADQAAPVKMDPTADKVLTALSGHMQGLKRFRCDLALLMISEMEGMKQEITTSYSFAMERPNKLALRHVRGLAGNTIVGDGKQLVTFANALNRYQQQDSPKEFETLFEGPGPMTGSMLFLDSLLRKDVRAAIMEGVTEVTYAGKEQVDGRECDRLRFVQEEFDWEMWVTTGDQPVVLRVFSDMSKGFPAMGEQTPAVKGMKMTVLNRMSGWQLNPELPEDTFVFKAPEGAKKTSTLFEAEDDEPMDDLPPNVEIKKLPEAPKAPEAAATNAVKKETKE
jgi:hypothetical protein